MNQEILNPRLPHKHLNTKWLALVCLLMLCGCNMMGVDFGGGGPGSEQCLDETVNDAKLCRLVGNNAEGLCVLSSVVGDIKTMLQNAGGNLFEGIKNSIITQSLIPAVFTIFVMIYGIMFVLGMVQQNAWSIVVNVIKMGIIVSIFSPAGWTYFSDTLGGFVRSGTDEIIGVVSHEMLDQLGTVTNTASTGIAYSGKTPITLFSQFMPTSGAWAGSTANPLFPLDLLLGEIISPKNLAIMQASGGEGTAGWGFAYVAIYALGVFYLLGAIAKALWVYLMSLIATYLLLGMFPIFIIFILFRRTKGLFDGYVGLLISFMLQPILLFTFIALFAAMIAVSISDISGKITVCYSCTGEGSTAKCGWKFSNQAHDFACSPMPGGSRGFAPAFEAECKQLNDDISSMFPSLLIFMLLCYICNNFTGFVGAIASSIAGGVSLSGISGFMQGAFSGIGKQFQSQITSKILR